MAKWNAYEHKQTVKRVLLNGEELRWAFACDTDEGWVDVYLTTENGNPYIAKKQLDGTWLARKPGQFRTVADIPDDWEPAWERRYGTVTVEMKAAGNV